MLYFRFDVKSGQILEVTQVLNRSGALQYRLKEIDGTNTGWAYQYQLKAAPDPATYQFPIEEVLKKKKNKCLVKWLFYPNKYNEWIDCATIKTGNADRSAPKVTA